MKYYILEQGNPAYNFYKKIHPLVQFKDRSGKVFATVIEGDSLLVPHHLLLCGDAPELFRLHASKAASKYMVPPKKYRTCKKEKIWSVLDTTPFTDYPVEIRDLEIKVVVGERYNWSDTEVSCHAELTLVPDNVGGFKEELEVLLTGLQYKENAPIPGFELQIVEGTGDHDAIVTVKDVVIKGWDDAFYPSIKDAKRYTYPIPEDNITIAAKPHPEYKVESLQELEELENVERTLSKEIGKLERILENPEVPQERKENVQTKLQILIAQYDEAVERVEDMNEKLDELCVNTSFSPHRETQWTVLD